MEQSSWKADNNTITKRNLPENFDAFVLIDVHRKFQANIFSVLQEENQRMNIFLLHFWMKCLFSFVIKLCQNFLILSTEHAVCRQPSWCKSYQLNPSHFRPGMKYIEMQSRKCFTSDGDTYFSFNSKYEQLKEILLFYVWISIYISVSSTQNKYKLYIRRFLCLPIKAFFTKKKWFLVLIAVLILSKFRRS